MRADNHKHCWGVTVKRKWCKLPRIGWLFCGHHRRWAIGVLVTSVTIGISYIGNLASIRSWLSSERQVRSVTDAVEDNGIFVVESITTENERIIALLEEELKCKNASLNALADLVSNPPPISRRAKALSKHIGPESPPYARALKAIVERRFDDARKLLEQDRERIRKESHRNFRATGHTYYYEQRYDEALAWYKKATVLLPEDLQTKESIASCYGLLGRLDDASMLLDALVGQYSQSDLPEDELALARVLNRRSYCRTLQNRLAEGQEDVDSAIAIAESTINVKSTRDAMGQLATCLGNRAAILILLKLPHRALDDIDRAIVLRRELLVNTLEDELRDSKLVEKFANNESRFGGHIRNSMAKSFADFSLRFGEVADDQLAWLYLVRGNCLATVDQFSLAIASYGAAFDMYTNCFKNQGETHYMLSIGTVLAQRSISSFELHDNQRALKDSNRSIKIFRGLISSDGRPSVNSQLATALFLRSIIRTGTNAHQEAVADLTEAELTFRQLINSEGQKQYVDTHKKVLDSLNAARENASIAASANSISQSEQSVPPDIVVRSHGPGTDCLIAFFRAWQRRNFDSMYEMTSHGRSRQVFVGSMKSSFVNARKIILEDETSDGRVLKVLLSMEVSDPPSVLAALRIHHESDNDVASNATVLSEHGIETFMDVKQTWYFVKSDGEYRIDLATGQSALKRQSNIMNYVLDAHLDQSSEYEKMFGKDGAKVYEASSMLVSIFMDLVDSDEDEAIKKYANDWNLRADAKIRKFEITPNRPTRNSVPIPIELDHLQGLSRARSLQQSADFEKAIDEFDTIIRLYPHSAMGYLGRGHCRLQSGKSLEKAVSDFTTTIRLAPQSTIAYEARGLSFLLCGQTENAQKDFAKLVTLAPYDAESYKRRANYFVAVGDTAKAEKDLAWADFLTTFPTFSRSTRTGIREFIKAACGDGYVGPALDHLTKDQEEFTLSLRGLIKHPDPAVRKTAAGMMVMRPQSSLKEADILSLLKDEDAGVRVRAAYHFDIPRSWTRVPNRLVGLLSDPIYKVAFAASSSLTTKFALDTLSPDVERSLISRLVQLLEADNTQTRLHAAHVISSVDLSMRETRRRAVDAITPLLGNDVPMVRGLVAITLGSFDGDAQIAVAQLNRIAKEDSDTNVRNAAMKALKRIRGEPGI